MLSLIEVQCPHCGARGQIMVPPIGAIIIGPCPQCSELVVIFCGHVLALDKDIMESGTTDDRREHLMLVLTEFLQDRIAKLLSDDVELLEGEIDETNEEIEPDPSEPKDQSKPISQLELKRFRDIDLRLLDNKAYFKSVFGSE